MRTCPELIAIDAPFEAGSTSIDSAIRTLVDLTERSESAAGIDAAGTSSGEEILIDIEVDGCRYLLVRMPKLNRCRVQLSPREQEIGRMVAKGHPNKVIADVLNISSWTVCTHLRRMFAKLGVGSRAAMVAQLLELGMITSDHRIPSESR